MLDTNTVSARLKGHSLVTVRLKATEPERVCLSVVTEAELLFGVAKRPGAKRLRAAVDEFLAAIDVPPWTVATARRYAVLRAGLERRAWHARPHDRGRMRTSMTPRS